MNETELESIYTATKEGRELWRLRNSMTFKLGIFLMRMVKNPFRLLIAPIDIVRLLLLNKETYQISYKPEADFLVIGIDKTGEFYSRQAHDIADRLQVASSTEVTLISNSHSIPIENKQIQWFRLPAAKANNYSRKEWNVTVERVVSTAISLSKPKQILFLGDYLYRGIIDALEGVGPKVRQYWVFSDQPSSIHLDNTKYPRIQKICIPTEGSGQSPPLGKEIILSEKKSAFFVDIGPKFEAVMDLLRTYSSADIFVVKRDDYVRTKMHRTIALSDIRSLPFREGAYFIIDQQSKLVPELLAVEIPGLLLLEEKIESPILATMVQDLELYHGLVVARRLDSIDLSESIDYMVSREGLGALEPHKGDYLASWLINHHTN